MSNRGPDQPPQYPPRTLDPSAADGTAGSSAASAPTEQQPTPAAAARPAAPRTRTRTRKPPQPTAAPAPAPEAAPEAAAPPAAPETTVAVPVDNGPPTAAMSRVDDDQSRDTRGSSPVQAPPGQARPAALSSGDTDERASAAVDEAPPARRARSTQRARLRIARVDPWSVMKMAFALSIAFAIVTVIAVAIVWTVLDTAGVWESINKSVDTLTNPDAGSGFEVEEFVGLGRVLGLSMVLAAANVVLLTALATLAAFLYNLAAALLGGLEVTLTEER
jgi:hypothetical protein